MNVETLEDLFGYQLQHAYYAERTQVELLAEMAAAVPNDDLGERFTAHLEVTERQVERLEGVFDALGRRPQASRSQAVDGLAESRRLRQESTDGEPAGGGTTGGESTVVDELEVALLAERLEIRSYETLVTLAGRLAYADDVVAPLESTLAEERETLQALEDLETELPVAASVELEDV